MPKPSSGMIILGVRPRSGLWENVVLGIPTHQWLFFSSHVSEEEISNMRSELEKYGIQMPAFSKIGGILANELSVDEAACKRKEPYSFPAGSSELGRELAPLSHW